MKTYPKHPKILSEGTLRVEKIASLKGNTLGKVENFILDVTAGRVALALLSLKGEDRQKFLSGPLGGHGTGHLHMPSFSMSIAFKLKGAPSFNKGDLSGWWDRFLLPVIIFYGMAAISNGIANILVGNIGIPF